MTIEIPLQNLALLDVVAVLVPIPNKPLSIGQVGTIVEILDTGIFEVEFSDRLGHTLLTCALPATHLLKLEYVMQQAA